MRNRVREVKEKILDSVRNISVSFKEIIFATAITLIVIGTFVINLTLTSLGLFGVAVAPYFAYLFHKIQLPGGVNIELRDLEKATARLEETGLVVKRDEDQASYLLVGEHDPNLALVGLRIEIEKRLTSILRTVGEEYILDRLRKAHDSGRATRISRGKLNALEYMEQRKKISFIDRLSTAEKLSILSEIGTLDRDEVSALSDLMPLLNRAAHGGVVDSSTYSWAMNIGPSLLAGLDLRAEHAGHPISSG